MPWSYQDEQRLQSDITDEIMGGCQDLERVLKLPYPEAVFQAEGFRLHDTPQTGAPNSSARPSISRSGAVQQLAISERRRDCSKFGAIFSFRMLRPKTRYTYTFYGTGLATDFHARKKVASRKL